MTAVTTVFDSLECYESLKDAGMSDAQAKVETATLQKLFKERAFDALEYYFNLKEAGVPEKQAMGQAVAMQNVLWGPRAV